MLKDHQAQLLSSSDLRCYTVMILMHPYCHHWTTTPCKIVLLLPDSHRLFLSGRSMAYGIDHRQRRLANPFCWLDRSIWLP
ncbi:hypothetical protein TNCV_345291 [Trichonephila clavipes]|nr:hypothetical protein TNCV_345291 [Trichonephila clavipes]